MQTTSSEMRRVGVIGGGQLAWMMAKPAAALGLKLVVQTPHTTDPAVAIATHTILGAVDDAVATAQLASSCEIITFENEFVDLQALSALAQRGVCFRPQLDVLTPLLDKYTQRCFLRDLGLPVPHFYPLELLPDRSDLALPLVLKVRRHGYDGQGTFIIRDPVALTTTLQQIGHTDVLVEEFVPFERELAVLAARSETGEIVVYPVVETYQKNQVCQRVIVPAEVKPETVKDVTAIVYTLLDRLNAIGLFAVELFLTATGQVLVNEIAPRTHNSGHYTIEACRTSQFEQHLRAVCSLPLGSPALLCSGAVMVNLLGFEQSCSDYATRREQLAALPHASVHWYGKTESRPGRKLGHVTMLLPDGTGIDRQSWALAMAQKVEAIWYGP
ncbi:5-(carboxyamino)imidazole ribonucleotide synthase [Leptolyngbya sp. 'hensonii']|uniref:5-(carboxyamino)imidazole ribonucleotide synthase n=1 Tax=Leptolyngbya sp. 'hensonii' TaxID=1922337 RepID=UPI00209B0012|nr:5-(carboxyamino)imidazole ribonucleotide synthase [Leptolyngbya sp. 'hensonii']